MCVYVFSCFQLFATPWTEAHKAPLSMKFFRQEYWNTRILGYLFLLQGIFPTQGLNPHLLWLWYLQANSLWRSGQESICPPVQETQETRVQSLGWEDPLE